MDWFYAQNGAQQGPVDATALRALLAAGTLQQHDLVWRDGMAAWMPIHQVPELSGSAAGAMSATPVPAPGPGFAAAPQGYTPPAPTYGAPNQGYAAAASYAPRPAGAYGYGQPLGPSQQGLAIAALICSLVMPIVGLIFAIIALKAMKTHHNDEGRGMAVAGLVISIVYLSIGCLGILLFLGMIGAAASAAH